MQAVTCARGAMQQVSAGLPVIGCSDPAHLLSADAAKPSPLTVQVHVFVGKRPFVLSAGCSCHHGLCRTVPQR